MRTAPILAAALLLLGSAVILLGGAMIVSDEVASVSDTAPPSPAEAAPPAPTPTVLSKAAGPAEVPAAPPSSRMVAPKVVAPPQVSVDDLEREAPREPLSQLSLALPPPPKPSNKWSGTPFFRPVATESAVFESMDRTITIAGAGSLSSDETCLSHGVSWPCGVRARSAFRLWLRGRALVCKLPPDSDAVSIVAPCRLGKQDVGAWLVSNGWARALPGGPYEQAEEKAQAAGLGIFGEPPDTSGLSAVPSAPAPSMPDQPILVE
jgi:endonuclease YncB( thermonuclease family)